MQAALSETKASHREFFEDHPHPMWVYDCDSFRLLAVNRAAIEQYGYTREEFLGMRLTDLHPPEETGLVFKALRTTSGCLPTRADWHHRKKNRTIIEVEIACRSLAFDARAAALVVSIDITARRRAERRAAAFSNLGRRLSAARTPKEAAVIIAESADALFGWDACIFDLYSPDRQNSQTVLCMDTIAGRRTEIALEPTVAKLSLIARQTFENGPRLILRPENASFPADGIPFGDKTRPSASLMYVPVQQDANWIGLLSFQSYTPEAYSEQDLAALQALAEHCAAALERIRTETALRENRQEILRLNADLERRVRERTAQLEALNKELEAFSYSVSHDLRAPLRSIRGFSEILVERYSNSLDARGREFLRRTTESSQHMDSLIEDLLQLSRLSRSELRRQSVDLSALARAIAAELQKSDPQRRVQFVIALDLRARGDQHLLRVVLENLLRNAWKFTSKTAEPRIEFGAIDEPEPAFFVRDNGAGFDMAYAAKLFGVFQRLHSSSEFPGTGIGLATVQRIINRHGGRIWANAAVGQGATFCFTLPAETLF